MLFIDNHHQIIVHHIKGGITQGENEMVEEVKIQDYHDIISDVRWANKRAYFFS